MRGLPVLVGVTALVVACGTPAPSGDSVQPGTAFLARHRAMNGGPAALVMGTLVEKDGCLLLDGPDGLALPLWPPDASVWVIDGVTTIVDGHGLPALEVGGQASFGGGYDYTLDFAEQQSGPIPERCRTRAYILVNDMVPVPRT